MSARACQILYVAANADDAQIASDALRAFDRQVFHVKTRDEALAYLRGLSPYTGNARPDIVLLDMDLPSGQSSLLLSDLKSSDSLRRIPVIALGSTSQGRSATEAYDQFANCFLTKPHSKEEFVRVLATLNEFWFSVAKLPRA